MTEYYKIKIQGGILFFLLERDIPKDPFVTVIRLFRVLFSAQPVCHGTDEAVLRRASCLPPGEVH